MTGRLEDKVCMITGAARGIGAATARAFLDAGASVVLADKREELGEATTAALQETYGRAARFVSLDVTSAASWTSSVSQVLDWFERVDVLVNNAGIIRVTPLIDCTPEDFRKIIETNLVGAFLGMKATVDTMKLHGGGSIINFSSPQGLEGRHGMPAYTASKFAVRGLTKTAAIELGVYGIRVNTVVPGPTRTPMTNRAGWSEADYERAYENYPLGRMADPSEIASLCVFLASDEASYCTGADFVADGGVTAGKPRDPS